MVLEKSRFTESPSQLIREHGDLLRLLIGQRLHAGWIAWDAEDDEWWADEAVILQIGGRQLEIVCSKMNEMALTWGEVDLHAMPSHVAEWGNDHLKWRENGHEVLESACGGIVQSVCVVEYRFRSRRVGGGDHSEAWLLNGLEFRLSTGVVHVFNALDENGLDDGLAPSPDLRRTSV